MRFLCALVNNGGFHLYEAYLSAQQNQESPHLRLQSQNGHQRRKKGPQQKKSQGKSPPYPGLKSEPMVRLYRLRKSEDFKKVLDGRKVALRNDVASIFFAKNDEGHARIGISTSTKLGNAVVRARVRRQVRAQINETGILVDPYDIVIIIRKGYLEHSFHENLQTFEKAFRSLRESSKGEKK